MNALDNRTVVVVALGIAQTLAWGSTYYLPAILARPMAAEFGIAPSLIYAMFSAALLVSAFAGPWVGRRIDRKGGRSMLAASSLVLAFALALLGWAPTPVVLGIAWLVMGMGMSMGLYESAFASLVAAYGAEARRPITGITLFAGFASTIAWPLTGLLDGTVGWRGACMVWAAVHLLVCAPLYVGLLPRGRQATQEQASDPAQSSGPEEPLGPAKPNRAMLLLGFVFASTWFTSTAMAAHLPTVLELAGASAVAAIAAAALIGPAQVAARLLEFSLLRNVHPLVSARLATLTHPAGVGILLSTGAPAASVFTVLHGGGNGLLTIAKGTLPLAVFGSTGYGLRQGLLGVPARLGQAIAPLAFGLALDLFGNGALLITAALGLASYAALAAMEKPARMARH
jgi:MFS family permease